VTISSNFLSGRLETDAIALHCDGGIALRLDGSAGAGGGFEDVSKTRRATMRCRRRGDEAQINLDF